MEAKDLMIGDLYYIKCSQDCHGHRIDYISELEEEVGVDGEILSLDMIEPIPLTPEVLARMGFTIEEVPKYDDTYTEDEYTATIKCVDNRKCEVEIEYKTYWKKLMAFNYDPHNILGFTSIETQVEYVHELQHILRVMKVDKELELLKERGSNQ